MRIEIPKRLVRMMGGEIAVDVATRTLSRCVVTTRALASDGGIVVPDGINTRAFQANAVVLSMHGFGTSFPVIGRSLGLERDAKGLWSSTQFADTPQGREIAYLYGVNEAREVYCRAWSFGWDTTEIEWWSLERARTWLGADWDEETVPMHVKRGGEVWVATKSVMHEYSAVPVGADRNALTRAAREKGVDLAGRMLMELDLGEARAQLATLKNENQETRARVERLERDLQALSRNDASAAAQGDAEAIRLEIEDWVRELKRR